MQKTLSRRTLKFIALAKNEATTDGYQKFEPITRGPWVNGLIIFLLIPVIACYLVWSFLLRPFGKKEETS